MYLERDCPSCSSKSQKDSVKIGARRSAESMSFEDLKTFWHGFRRDSTFFSYSRCRTCGLLFCPKFFKAEQLAELYSEMPDNTNSEDIDALLATQKGYFTEIVDSGYCGGKTLEIGADIGLFVEAIRHARPNEVVDAVEPNSRVRNRLIAAVGIHGKVFSGIEEIPITSKYRLITAVHVLDHLVDFTSVLDEFKKRLVPGGQLYMVVHNEKSLLRHVLGRKWPPFCLQHPHLFNRETLSAALRERGFSDVSVRRTTNHFSLRHIVRVITNLLGLPKSIAKLFPSLVLPLKLGNISVSAKLGESRQ